MALFGSARDASVLRKMNREVLHKILDTEVEIYKISLEATQANIYDEALQKYYFDPVVLRSFIDYGEKQNEVSNTGIEFKRSPSFAFLKDDLKDINLVLDIGDVISWNSQYFEIDMLNTSQYWGERNETKMIGYERNQISEFGYDISVVAQCHLARETRINLVSNLHVGNQSAIKNSVVKKKSIYD